MQVCPARPAVHSKEEPALQIGQSPQELLEMFNETQRNMMDLNKKRLAALAEVKALRARVAELGALLTRCFSLGQLLHSVNSITYAYRHRFTQDSNEE